MKKRLLAMLLVVTMVFSLVPGIALTASAAGETVSTSLKNLEFVAGDEQRFFVETTGDKSETVLGYMTVTDSNGAPIDITKVRAKYFETTTNTWLPLTIDSSGQAVFEPSSGFPMANATSWFEVVVDDAGIYNYKIEMCQVLNPSTVVASTSGVFFVNEEEAPAASWTVTFMPNCADAYEMPEAQVVEDGGMATEPAEPSRDGYTFGGWFTEKACTNAWDFAADGVTADLKLYAKWTAVPGDTYYTVAYYENGAGVYNMPLVNPVSVKSGEAVTIPTPVRDGYTFKGWNAAADGTGAAVTAIAAIDQDYELYAQWEEDVVNYTVTFPAAGDVANGWDISKTGALTFKAGKQVAFSVTVQDGFDPASLQVTYTLGGDEIPMAPTGKSGNIYYYLLTVTEDTEIAVYNLKHLSYQAFLPVGESFTVEFTEVDGATIYNASKIAPVKYGGSFTFEVTAKDGYTITGVYDNGHALSLGASSYTILDVQEDHTITVDMTANTFYIVNYIVDNANYANYQQVESGTDLALLEDPVKTGYVFDGWYTDAAYSAAAADPTTITANTEFYGKFDAETFTISYDANGGAFAGTAPTTTKTYGQAVALTDEIPTYTGYKFLGWSKLDDATVASYGAGATFSEEIDADLTLYAVWEIETYTVTLPAGTGFTASSEMSPVVEYDGSYTFTVTVDRDYATVEPVVKANGVELTNPTGVENADESVSYTYTIDNIQADQVISVVVEKNETFTVSFYAVKYYENPDDASDYAYDDPYIYQTQEVEDTYKAAQPADPTAEGYIFTGWYTVAAGSDFAIDGTDYDLDAAYDFAAPVTADLIVVAKMEMITPTVTIPAEKAGYTDNITDPATTDVAGIETATVKYGETVEFVVVVPAGYDATKMQVGANGTALTPTEIAPAGADPLAVEFTFTLTNVTEDINVTIVGIERKTVTIIYNANSRDDVSGMPEDQIVNYWVSGASDNSTITLQEPVRTGYEFLGWDIDSEATTASYLPGDEADFIANTTLYAIWKAVDTDITIEVSDVAVVASGGENAKEYEGEKVTLTAALADGSGNFAPVSNGSFVFSNETTGEIVIVPANGTNGAVAELTMGDYPTTNVFSVFYQADADEGYGTSSTVSVEVDPLSTAISWANDGTAVDAADATVTVWQDDGDGVFDDTADTALAVGDTMIATETYFLQLPAVYPMDDQTNALTANAQYTVKWMYEDPDNGWTELGYESADVVKLSPEFYNYSYKAYVYPVTDDATSHFKKAAAFDQEAYGTIETEYTTYLVTLPTDPVAKQDTVTTLAVTDADEEPATVQINGATDVFSADHLAQFEGQNVTLTASVVDANGAAVTTGYVNFFKQSDPSTALNDSPVAVDTNGNAIFEAEMSEYGTDALSSFDEFFAVYVENDTYNESTSADETVYIKSTTIQTPAVKSSEPDEDGDYATTYTEDLEGLMTGVETVFTLQADGSETEAGAANWSVVALDGRTVDAANYEIHWWKFEKDNPEELTDNVGLESFTVTENDENTYYYLELLPLNDMTVGAASMKLRFSAKQDVSLTVTADPAEQWQLNDVVLTAVVTGTAADPTMKPTGNVAFFYQGDGMTDWTFIELKDLVENAVTGEMEAVITTKDLPVDPTDNTWQNVTVTAVYLGDDTFNASLNWTDTSADGVADADEVGDDASVIPFVVSIYSSVVYANSSVENVVGFFDQTNADNGIVIYPEGEGDAVFKAGEANVNLKLTDIYTLDYDEGISDDWTLLEHAVDYSVEWQYVENYKAYEGTDVNEWPWQTIPGTGDNVTAQIATVEDNAAYRAKITVLDAPAVQGSYTEVAQAVPGCKYYYSNIMSAQDGECILTANFNTSAQGAGNEGAVEGETVYVQAFVMGAEGTTPQADVSIIVEDSAANIVFETETPVKTVNGYAGLTWEAAEPGIYTITVSAESTNGYAIPSVTRQMIVRDNDYTITLVEGSFVYDSKAQGVAIQIDDMCDDFTDLAQKAWTVSYFDAEGNQVAEPDQVGEYEAVVTLPESAFWTEATETYTLVIDKREVSVVDFIAQAKIYSTNDDGSANKDVNIVEIVLGDAKVDAKGVPAGDDGVINGDSLYAVGTGTIDVATAGTSGIASLVGVKLMGDDADNYKLVDSSYTETLPVMRSQVYGDIQTKEVAFQAGATTQLDTTKVKLIDQAGKEITAEDYTVTYYYHNGEGVELVDGFSKLGIYEVIVRPEQDNYKGGVSKTINVVNGAGSDDAPVAIDSAILNLSNTVELYGNPENKGIVVTATSDVDYDLWYSDGVYYGSTAPTDAGRYMVYAYYENYAGDNQYFSGIYTVVKARPEFTVEMILPTQEYNSAPAFCDTKITYTAGDDTAECYATYTGDTIIGENMADSGVNVEYTEPTQVGKYMATVHVLESDNYTAGEASAAFEITKKALTVTADSLAKHQYGAYPEFGVNYEGLATGGIAADTSLRDIEIQPEIVFNPDAEGMSDYSNSAMDQVGTYVLHPIDILSRNYDVTLVDGTFAVDKSNVNELLTIRGLPYNNDGAQDLVYYGDQIQLSAYGWQDAATTVINTSAILNWSIVDDTMAAGTVTIDPKTGILSVDGVGTFKVKVTRGFGAQTIEYTTPEIVAAKQEVIVNVPDVDDIYAGVLQSNGGTGRTALNAMMEDVGLTAADLDVTSNTRENVGTQCTGSEVSAANAYYVSEHYRGAYTINDLDLTVAPLAQTDVYGDGADWSNKDTVTGFVYSETTRANGKAALEGSDGGYYESVPNDLVNPDVGEYEILIAGAENKNYNIHYTTWPNAENYTITEYAMDVYVGGMNAIIGTTGGSVNPEGDYPPDGVEAARIGTSYDVYTMYGEPRFAASFDLDDFNSYYNYDSLADLQGDFPSWLVTYNKLISTEANVSYDDPSVYLTGKSDYMYGQNISFMNYSESYYYGMQNVYQRPVELALEDSSATGIGIHKTQLGSLKSEIERQLTVNDHGGEGGLASLLNHHITDLQLEVCKADGTLMTDAEMEALPVGTTDVYVRVTNPNYRLCNDTLVSAADTYSGTPDFYVYKVSVEVFAECFVLKTDRFERGYSYVSCFYRDEFGNEIAADLPGGVNCVIYNYSADGVYSDKTPYATYTMTKGINVGSYRVSYSSLPGDTPFMMFAVAVNPGDYVIINGIA